MKIKKTIHGEFFATFALIVLIFESCLFMILWVYIIVIKTPVGSISLYLGFYILEVMMKKEKTLFNM